MSKLQEITSRANQLLQSGRIQEAIGLYLKVLHKQPRNAQLLFVLGTAYLETGQVEKSIQHLQRAVVFNPRNAAAYCNLGVALNELNRLDEAVKSYDKALFIKSDYADVYNNRGNALRNLRRLDEALESFDKAISHKPDYAEAHNNRGHVLVDLGRMEEALESHNRAALLRPGLGEIYNSRGNVLKALKRLDEALSDYDQAITIKPDYAEAYCNRGVTLHELKRLDEALASYDKAVFNKPEYAEAYNNRGGVLRDLARLEDALASYDKALAIRSDYVDAIYNRGVVFHELNCVDEALVQYDKVLEIQPDHVEAHWNKSLLLLLTENFLEGWALYEWRFKREATASHYCAFSQPAWRGHTDIKGKRLLIQSEQGLGDVIQFCRYLPLISALGAEIILEVHAPLASLVSTIPCPVTVVSKGHPLPQFDAYCPVMSLPYAFKTTIEEIPAETPYLFSDGEKVRQWVCRLGDKSRLRVGIAWSGSVEHVNDKSRSVRLEELLPLMDLPVEWHSLQKEYRQQDIPVLNRNPEIRQHQDDIKDFADTAALMECLDLVLSVDTSVAHLAGALGKPVWILLPYRPEFRWLLERADSPWYPSAKLYRQSSAGDWEGLIRKVLLDMKSLIEK